MASDPTINHWPQVFSEYPGQPEVEMEVLRGQYKVLSQLHLPGSTHKMLFQVEPMMDYVLNRMQQLSLIIHNNKKQTV